jgi:hypothetical protein
MRYHQILQSQPPGRIYFATGTWRSAVKTFWGVSSRWVKIASAMIALVAFILSWPVLESFFKQRFLIEKKKSKT